MSKKGAIFTFDAGLAIFLVVSIMAISSFYITKADRPVWSKIEVIKTMDSVVAALDNTGTLKTMNLELIENETAEMLGPEYDFAFLIEEYDAGYTNTQNLTIRAPTDKNTFVNSNSFIFFTDNGAEIDKYYLLKYWIWEKNEE